MVEIDMDDSRGHERPAGRPPADRPRFRRKQFKIVTHRNEGASDQNVIALLDVQAIGHEHMDEAHRCQEREDDAWHIENTLTRRSHCSVPKRKDIRCGTAGGKSRFEVTLGNRAWTSRLEITLGNAHGYT